MKRIRMDQEAYGEGSTFSITIATAERQPFLNEESTVATALESLRTAAAKYSASVYAYCFMPDHAHLLVEVPAGENLIDFVRHFKQLSAYAFRASKGRVLWQRRFYDHALRTEEDLEVVAQYIWDNPVRAGICEEASSLPHSGSLVWEVPFMSGSEDPDLQRPPPRHRTTVGTGLETRANSR